MTHVISKDGTSIAFERSGTGPSVIFVASALADRSDTAKLAARVAQHFTVINYDRRGRGESGDTLPYAMEREIEDIAALIEAVGEPACLFGNSSGAVLALDTANKLGAKVKKLALFEPPFIIDDSRPPLREDFVGQVNDLVQADRRSDAVKLFMSKGLGIPSIGVLLMRFMPGWSAMKTMAHTLAYDLMLLEGTQAGTPLPATRWDRISPPTLVLTGAKSEAFFHSGARALADLLPHAEHRILQGLHHGSVAMAAPSLASTLIEFFMSKQEVYEGRHASSFTG